MKLNQRYKYILPLILLFLFIQLGYTALTETTSLEYRDQVCDLLDSEVEEGQVVSDDERESWQNNRESLKTARNNENKFEEWAKGDGKVEDMLWQILPFIMVFLVFASLSMLGLLSYICCCVCEKCCPPCKLCCKSCDKKTPYQGFSLFWPGVGVAITGLEIFIICIIGLTYSSGIENSFNVFFCASLQGLHGFNYGGGTFNGVEYLNTEITKFKNEELGDLNTQTANTFTGRPQIIDNYYANMQYISEQMKIECDGANCCENKPDSFACSWQTGPIDFAYSANPYLDTTSTSDQESVYFNGVWQGQVEAAEQVYERAFEGISAAIDSLEASAQGITGISAEFANSIDDAVEGITKFQDSVQDIMKNLTDTHDSGSGALSLFTMTLDTLFIIFIVFSILSGVSVFLIYWKKMFRLRIFLHSCWCIYALLMIFTFLFTSILMAVSMAGEQTCEVIENALQDPIKFDEYADKLDEQVRGKFKICKKELNLKDGDYGGNDSVAKAFDLDDELDTIVSMRDSIAAFETEAGQASDNLKDLQKVIDEDLSVMGDILDELRDDQQFTVGGTTSLEHLELDYALDKFATDLHPSCPGFDSLYYIKAEEDCSIDPFVLYINLEEPIINNKCYLIRDSNYKNNGSSLDSCGGNTVEAIEAWRNEKNILVGFKIQQNDDLTANLQALLDYQNDVYIAKVTAFSGNVQDALDFIAHEDTGMLRNIHCFWFGEQLDNFYEAYCVSFINSCYNLGFVMAWFSFGLFFGSFFLFMTARIMGHNSRQAQQVKGDEQKDQFGAVIATGNGFEMQQQQQEYPIVTGNGFDMQQQEPQDQQQQPQNYQQQYMEVAEDNNNKQYDPYNNQESAKQLNIEDESQD